MSHNLLSFSTELHGEHFQSNGANIANSNHLDTAQIDTILERLKNLTCEQNNANESTNINETTHVNETNHADNEVNRKLISELCDTIEHLVCINDDILIRVISVLTYITSYAKSEAHWIRNIIVKCVFNFISMNKDLILTCSRFKGSNLIVIIFLKCIEVQKDKNCTESTRNALKVFEAKWSPIIWSAKIFHKTVNNVLQTVHTHSLHGSSLNESLQWLISMFNFIPRHFASTLLECRGDQHQNHQSHHNHQILQCNNNHHNHKSCLFTMNVNFSRSAFTYLNRADRKMISKCIRLYIGHSRNTICSGFTTDRKRCEGYKQKGAKLCAMHQRQLVNISTRLMQFTPLYENLIHVITIYY